MGREIKKSENQVQICGTLKQMNLKMEEGVEYTLGRNTPNEESHVGRRIVKKDFKQPMFVIEVNGQDIGVNFFAQTEKTIGYLTNEVEDNSQFKALETVMNKYIAKAEAVEGVEASRVLVKGLFVRNEYASEKTNYEFKSIGGINGRTITSNNVPEEDFADCSISGIIRSIRDEVNTLTEEETGRKLVDFYFFDSKKDVFPIELAVEEDIAEDFADYYENGDCTVLNYEIISRQVGVKKPSGAGFGGRRESKAINGYTREEYSVISGGVKFEDEENEFFISAEQIKEAIKARELKKDAIVKSAKDSVDSNKTKPNVSGASKGKPKKFGQQTSTPMTNEIDEEETPF